MKFKAKKKLITLQKKKVNNKKNNKNNAKNIVVLSLFTGFLVAGIVFARYGYKALSLLSFFCATGIILFHLPVNYALATSFLSVSLSLISNFFSLLNHLINGVQYNNLNK